MNARATDDDLEHARRLASEAPPVGAERYAQLVELAKRVLRDQRRRDEQQQRTA